MGTCFTVGSLPVMGNSRRRQAASEEPMYRRVTNCLTSFSSSSSRATETRVAQKLKEFQLENSVYNSWFPARIVRGERALVCLRGHVQCLVSAYVHRNHYYFLDLDPFHALLMEPEGQQERLVGLKPPDM
ncbi:uncharacterized protein LOC127751163 isoform X1 [Frankliniella occidentalis]|uniref:Uncharacterized protein LOC127751163 isoform X1 n=1 Tax=Frankliniella occidentalis TaxID=133901 RepID=A0A9C6X6S4_FRAOC|nr:uncharacterized protein LOC127751163 isoform X1 [Frankliniella occidentalis]